MSEERTGIPHIILGGCGHLGSRIAEELCARGYQVVVIDTAADHQDLACGYRVITGDMCDEDVLLHAGILTAHCLLAVTGDDRTNLEAAVTARHLAPELRTVVRLYDQSIAKGIEEAFGVQALSASFLALPAYISAATEDTILAAFDIDGQQLTFYHSAQAARVNGIAVCREDEKLQVAETATCADTQQFIVSLNELQCPTRAARQRRKSPRLRRGGGRWLVALHPRAVQQTLRSGWQHTALITRRLVLALLAVVVLSVSVFTLVGNMSSLDALYFVITTLTTVGYGDINLQHAPMLLKAYGILMMLCGAALLATVYAIISDFVLTARIEYLLGRRAVTLSDHIVVVGLGKVGYRVSKTLQSQGYTVVAVEANEDSDHVSASRLMMPVIIGNATRTSVLLKAGTERASTILALTDNPMVNLGVILHARQLNAHIRTVVRTYENRFAGKLRNFNFNAIISTSAIAAPVFTNAAIYPGVEGSMTFGGEEILVVRHPVTASSPLVNRSVAAIGEESGIAVVMVADNPDTEYRLAKVAQLLREGQIAVLLVTHNHLSRLAIAPKLLDESQI